MSLLFVKYYADLTLKYHESNVKSSESVAFVLVGSDATSLDDLLMPDDSWYHEGLVFKGRNVKINTLSGKVGHKSPVIRAVSQTNGHQNCADAKTWKTRIVLSFNFKCSLNKSLGLSYTNMSSTWTLRYKRRAWAGTFMSQNNRYEF
jgi:hypothetical protein